MTVPVFAGSAPTSITLASSQNPSILGHAVTLTAVISPSTATGAVTFYDGTNVLETVPVQYGQAAFTTVLLPSGPRSVKAYYGGDANYASGSSAVLVQNVTAQQQTGFLPEVNFGDLTYVSSIAVADFNGDGIPDLATNGYIQSQGISSISVMLGNGDGTFQNALLNPVGAGFASVAVGDFNGDGKPDLIAVTEYTISVFLGNGDGTFQPPVDYSGFFESALVADVNGDGKADLVINAVYNVQTMLGNGDGTFQSAVNATGSSVLLLGLAVGDFNGDGKTDVAATGAFDSGTTYGTQILLGNGDGTFQAQTLYAFPLDATAASTVAADFNGDSHVDLVIGTTYGDSGVAVLLGNGDGTFQPAAYYPAGNGGGANGGSLVVADFNGDGKPDLASAGAFFPNNQFAVLFGNGDGTFQPAVTYAATFPLLVAAADFNGDGVTDLVVSDGSLGTLLGQPLAPCLLPSSSSITTDSAGVQFVMYLYGGACAWSLSTTSPWIDLSPMSGGVGGNVTVTVEPNSTGADRSGSISLTTLGRLSYIIPVTERSTAEVFADVTPSDFYFDAANLLYAKGITNGCSTNPLDFCPNDDVTRAEMAIFIVRSIFGGDNFTAPTTPYFNDVGPSDFGFAWIQEMAALGITNGCGNNDFCPDDDVTRAEMAIFIIRARYGATANPDYSPTPFFTDVPANAFGFSSIQRMKMDNITSGCTATTYCPDDAVTRGDMAIFVMRGGYNQLLPAGEPVISQVGPASIPLGQLTTVTVTGVNTNFGAGTIVNPIPGVAMGNINVTSPTSFTVDLTPAANAALVPLSIWVTTGTQEAILPNGLTLQ